jgi:hypothetical protein
MRSAVMALSWELVARHRWLMALAGVWVLLGCGLGLVLPEAVRAPEVGAGLLIALTLPLVFVLAELVHGSAARLEERRSGFPARLYTLPAPVAVLAGPSLVLPTLVIACCWVLVDLCLLRFFGIESPTFWPPLAAAASVALIQALTWMPFPLPYLRLACFTVLIPAVYAGTAMLVALEVGEAVLSLLFLALLVLGYGLALLGVAWGRCGLGVRERVRVGPVAVAPERAPLAKPFSSLLRAQVWLEWRSYAPVSLFFAGMCLVIILPSMTFLDYGLKHDLPAVAWWAPRAREAVGDSWLVMAYLLFVPILLSFTGCGDTGCTARQRGPLAYSPFIATRPISTADRVKARLLACALAAGCTWGLVLAGTLAWAIVMGRLGEMSERLVSGTGSVPAAAGASAGGLLLLLAITWLWMAHGVWVAFLGRPVLILASACTGLTFWTVLALLMLQWREEWGPIVGGVVALGLLLKSLAIAWVIRALHRSRLVKPTTPWIALGSWVVLAGIVVSLVLSWLPDRNGLLLAGVAVLMLPLARCLAAPLALAANRSR